MSDQPARASSGIPETMLALLGLAAVLAILSRIEKRQLVDELDSERRRRVEAEALSRRHKLDLDGALEKIHELRGSDAPPAGPTAAG